MRGGSHPEFSRPLAAPGSHEDIRHGLAGLLGWLLLLGLLAALLIAAATFDPRSWPSLVGDEASYLMAADSLAHDHDVRYQREDLDRFVELYQRNPEGLILQSPDHGATLVYGKPLFYPIFLALFLLAWPLHGPAIANALLLGLAAVFTARSLARFLGDAAPVWTAVLVFASATFVQVFWTHSDLFLLSLVAISLSLIGVGRSQARKITLFRQVSWRWLPWATAGTLLAVVVASRPFYAPLLLPLAVAAVAARQARSTAIAVAGSLLFCLGLTVAAQGTWTTYAGERLGYYSHTGFPYDDGSGSTRSTEEAWQERLAGGDNAWVGNPLGDEFGAQLLPFGVDLRVTSWNAVYLLFGRHVGFLIYFLPFLLGLIAFRSDAYRWSLVLALIVVVAAFVLARPFNFWGGGGALANRYLLPVYPVFWFLIGRRRAIAWPVGAVAIAALFLWPLWVAPRAFLRAEDGSYRYVSRITERLLPYETTQSHLKPAGREDFLHSEEGGIGLWIKPLSPRFDEDHGWIALSPGDHSGTLLIGFERPLRAFVLTEGIAVSQDPVDGAGELDQAASSGTRSDGRSIRIEPLRPRARHRMWWSRDLFYLYQVNLDKRLSAWISEATESGNGKSPSSTVWFRITGFE